MKNTLDNINWKLSDHSGTGTCNLKMSKYSCSYSWCQLDVTGLNLIAKNVKEAGVVWIWQVRFMAWSLELSIFMLSSMSSNLYFFHLLLWVLIITRNSFCKHFHIITPSSKYKQGKLNRIVVACLNAVEIMQIQLLGRLQMFLRPIEWVCYNWRRLQSHFPDFWKCRALEGTVTVLL